MGLSPLFQTVLIAMHCRFTVLQRTVFAIFVGFGLLFNTAQAEPDVHVRANDLFYGEVIYHYEQGEFFNALTLLNVAKHRGEGINGHGAFPELLEGSLMLSFGMHYEAKQHFERLLNGDNAHLLSAELKNQAWFYLGKVLYIEGDLPSAAQALGYVDVKLLKEGALELFYEWRYLRVQLGIKQGDLSVYQQLYLDDSDGPSEELLEIWSVYTKYNIGVAQQQDKPLEALRHFEETLQRIENSLLDTASNTDVPSLVSETRALADTLRLTIAQLYLHSQHFEQAADVLSKIPFTSVVSDEALFYFSLAHSQLKNYEIALSSLTRLSERVLFTPWLQQVPYAIAFLHEQLDSRALAIQAYEIAGRHYDQMLRALEQQHASLSPEVLLGALSLVSDDGAPNDLVLGSAHTQNDAYGRLNVVPSQNYIARVLSTESFQIALRDLHELVKLRARLVDWSTRIPSFEQSLETSASSRNQKLAKLTHALQAQDADLWLDQYAAYDSAITDALEKEDARFFMSEDQLFYADRIERAAKTLSVLPEGEQKRALQVRLARAKAYFTWHVEDTYGLNRWAAQAQLRALSSEMTDFSTRRTFLNAQLDSNDFQHGLELRVHEVKHEITNLLSQVGDAVDAANAQLLEKTKQELVRQMKVVEQYRLYSRHAHARLIDNEFLSVELNESAVDGDSADHADQAASSITDTEGLQK